MREREEGGSSEEQGSPCSLEMLVRGSSGGVGMPDISLENGQMFFPVGDPPLLPSSTDDAATLFRAELVFFFGLETLGSPSCIGHSDVAGLDTPSTLPG